MLHSTASKKPVLALNLSNTTYFTPEVPQREG